MLNTDGLTGNDHTSLRAPAVVALSTFRPVPHTMIRAMAIIQMEWPTQLSVNGQNLAVKGEVSREKIVWHQ